MTSKTTADWVKWLQEEGVGIPVLAEEQGVCHTCWTPTLSGTDGTPYFRCYDCQRLYKDLLTAAVPISYSVTEDLMSLIWQAKNQPEMGWLKRPLVSLLYEFLGLHLGCIERCNMGKFDLVTVVPSHESKRNGVDHLKSLLALVDGWPQPWDVDLLVKLQPSDAEKRRKALSTDLFALTPGRDVRGQRILIIDDLFTSGGTIASAANALVTAGARKPVALTVGRHLSIERPEVVALLNRHEGLGLDLQTCAVHTKLYF